MKPGDIESEIHFGVPPKLTNQIISLANLNDFEQITHEEGDLKVIRCFDPNENEVVIFNIPGIDKTNIIFSWPTET